MANAFTIFGEITTDTSKLKSGLAEAEKRLDATTKAISDTEKKATDLGKTNAVTARAFEKANEKIQEARSRLTEASAAYERGDISAKQFERALKDVERATSTTNSKLKDTNASLTDFENRASELPQTLNNVAGGLAKAGAALTAALTVPIVMATKAIITNGIAYENTLNQIGAISGATGEQMDRLKATAIELGNDMQLPGTSAATASQAMLQLVKAGFNVEQALDSAKGTILLAKAAMMEEGEAANITANLLNAFSMSAENASQVADLLAATANNSAQEVTDVAAAAVYAQTAFASAGMPIEDMATSLALLADKGIKGSVAGTALNAVLKNLKVPSKAAADALKGVELRDPKTKELLPLPQLMENIKKKTEGMTAAQKDAFMAKVFDERSMKAAQTLMDAGIKKWDETKTKVTEAGAAGKMAEAQMAGLGGKWEALGSQIETLGNEMYEAIKTPLTQIVSAISSVVSVIGEAFGSLPTPAKQVLAVLAVILAAIGPILLAVAGLVAMFAFLLPPILAVAGAITSAGGAFAALAVAVAPLKAALAVMFVPLIPIIAKVALVVGAIIAISYLLKKAWDSNFGGIQDKARAVADGISKAWGAVKGFFTKLFNDIKKVFNDFWAKNGDDIQKAADKILGILQSIGDFVSAVFNGIWAVVSPILKILFAYISNIFGGVWQVIKGVFSQIWNVISSVFMMIVHAINGDWVKVWETAKQMVSDTIDNITSILSGLVDIVMAPIDTLLGAFDSSREAFLKKAQEIGSAIIDGLVGMISNGWNSIWGAAKKLGMAVISGVKKTLGISSPSKVMAEFGKNTVEGFNLGLTQNTKKTVMAIDAFAKMVRGGFSKVGKDAVTGFIDSLGQLNVVLAQVPAEFAKIFGALDLTKFAKSVTGKAGEEALNWLTSIIKAEVDLTATTKSAQLELLLASSAFKGLSAEAQAYLRQVAGVADKNELAKEAQKKLNEELKAGEDAFKSFIDSFAPELTKLEQFQKLLANQPALEKAAAGAGMKVPDFIEYYTNLIKSEEVQTNLNALMTELGVATEKVLSPTEKLNAMLTDPAVLQAIEKIAKARGVDVGTVTGEMQAGATGKEQEGSAGFGKLSEFMKQFEPAKTQLQALNDLLADTTAVDLYAASIGMTTEAFKAKAVAQLASLQADQQLVDVMGQLGIATEQVLPIQEKLDTLMKDPAFLEAMQKRATLLGITVEKLKEMMEASAQLAGMSQLQADAISALNKGFEGIGDVFSKAVTEWDGTAKGFFSSIANGFKGLVTQLIGEMIRLMIVEQVMGLVGKLGIKGLGTAPVGKAEGGLIRGAGSGTSDSVPAMLSNGEYVIPAKSVRKFGVGFFESIRNMTMPSALAMAGGGYVGMPPVSSVSNTQSSVSNTTNNFTINAQGGNGNGQTGTMVQREILMALKKTERRNK